MNTFTPILKFTTAIAGLLALGLFAACSAPIDDELQAVHVVTYPVVEGSAEALGMIDFLNHDSTTVSVLDKEVPLDRRAAGNLVAHRNGGDGQYGSSDDDLFNSIEEVDAVRWVGTSSLQRLAGFAAAQGWVPQDDDLLGTWDRVSFSVNEAAFTLDLVNRADHSELDHDLGLDRRAADSIIEAQPVLSVAHLAGLYYVGNAALTLLKGAALEELDDEADGEEADEACIPELSLSPSSAADDLNSLLALSTTVGTPWAEIISLQVTGCEEWWSHPESTEAVTAALWNKAFHISWDDLPSRFREVDPLVPGGDRYLSRLELTLEVIEEHIGDGDWDPTAQAEGQALYDARHDLIDSLSLDVEAHPGAFVEQRIYFEMVECSEDSVALIDTRTGSILLLHEFANC